jgi:hypothetical protein
LVLDECSGESDADSRKSYGNQTRHEKLDRGRTKGRRTLGPQNMLFGPDFCLVPTKIRSTACQSLRPRLRNIPGIGNETVFESNGEE